MRRENISFGGGEIKSQCQEVALFLHIHSRINKRSNCGKMWRAGRLRLVRRHGFVLSTSFLVIHAAGGSSKFADVFEPSDMFLP